MNIPATLSQAATLSLHLYGDMYTSTSSSATDSTFVTYDDVLVTSSTRGTVMSEDFESGISAWGSCSGNLALASPSAAPDQWKRDVIYLGGQAIAEVDAAGVHELHLDYQGTPRVVTNRSTGAVEGIQAFGPYGEQMPPAAGTPPAQLVYQPLTGYTGHIAQDSTGLVYMRGRFYSPAWHRFLNSDQGVDPNSWNQMAYVGGSPMMAKDPSGLSTCLMLHSQTDVWGIGADGVYFHEVIDGRDELLACWGDSGGGNGGGGGRGGSSDPTPQAPELNRDKCQQIRDILNYEAQHGTSATAKWVSSSYGSSPGNRMGNFENPYPYSNGTPSAIGPVDLDWYTDLAGISSHPSITGRWGSGSLAKFGTRQDYYTLKTIHDGISKFTDPKYHFEKPYDDPFEGPAVWAVSEGMGYSKLFTPDFMAKNCPGQ